MWDRERFHKFNIKEGDSIYVITFSCTEVKGILFKIHDSGISVFTDDDEVMILYEDIELVGRGVKTANIKSLFKN